jgi:hypothetical protein
VFWYIAEDGSVVEDSRRRSATPSSGSTAMCSYRIEGDIGQDTALEIAASLRTP